MSQLRNYRPFGWTEPLGGKAATRQPSTGLTAAQAQEIVSLALRHGRPDGWAPQPWIILSGLVKPEEMERLGDLVLALAKYWFLVNLRGFAPIRSMTVHELVQHLVVASKQGRLTPAATDDTGLKGDTPLGLEIVITDEVRVASEDSGSEERWIERVYDQIRHKDADALAGLVDESDGAPEDGFDDSQSVRSMGQQSGGWLDFNDSLDTPILPAPPPSIAGNIPGRFRTLDHAYSPASLEAPPMCPVAPRTRNVTCTAHLEIQREVLTGRLYDLLLLLNQDPTVPRGAEVQGLKLPVPLDATSAEIDVWLDCSSHFTLAASSEMPTVVYDIASGCGSMQIRLEVVNPQYASPPFVSAYFRFRGQPCGRIIRYFQPLEGKLQWSNGSPFKPPAADQDIVLPHAGAPASIRYDAGAQIADLQINVLRGEFNDGKTYKLRAFYKDRSWETPKDHPWRLAEESRALVLSYMKDFMTADDKDRVDRLRGAGQQFWEALPEDFRRWVWAALQQGCTTILILSEEAYIPWELMLPMQDGNLRDKPLGVEFQIGRWIVGSNLPAVQSIPLRTGYIVCPANSNLSNAAKEVEFLISGLDPAFQPIEAITPATYEGVKDTLANQAPRDLLHFICHGKNDTSQKLLLEDRELVSYAVRTMPAYIAALKHHPLVFLNACQLGQQVRTMAGIGGFANAFLQMEASGVVAPLWSVDDSVALDVAKIFYSGMRARLPLAKVMQTIRLKAYTGGSDSYAAYCFYGDPCAVAEF